MTKIPAHGVFTNYTLAFHGEATGEPYSRFVKRAAILFDRLLFVREGLGDIRNPNNPFRGVWSVESMYDGPKDDQVVREYRALFLDEIDIWSDTVFVQEYENSDGLTSREKGGRFRAWLDAVVSDEVRRGIVGGSPGDFFERAKLYSATLSHDYKVLATLNRNNPDFAALFTQTHQDAALAAFADASPSADALLRVVSDIAFVDFGQLTWEQVFLLRRSKFVQDFRAKMSEWLSLHEQNSDAGRFTTAFRRFVTDALFRVLDEARPDIATTVLSALVGVVPVLGALAATKTIVDLNEDIRRRRENGWLYFIQRSRQVSSSDA